MFRLIPYTVIGMFPEWWQHPFVLSTYSELCHSKKTGSFCPLLFMGTESHEECEKKIVETRNESFSLFLQLHKQRDIQSTDIQVEIYHTHTKIISLHTQILQNRIKIYLFFHCIPHRKLIWIQNYVHSHTGATLSLRMNLQSNVINVETVLTTLQKENPLYIL